VTVGTDPLVTIALPARNAELTIRQTLESLRWQTLESWELLLMDDGSTDGTADIVRAFGDPRMRVVSAERSAGLATRLNEAIDLARGRYLARMDADDIAYPDRLRAQVDYLECHPEVDLLAARALVFKGDGEIVGLLPWQGEHRAIVARPWSGIPMPHPTWCGRTAWFRRWRYAYPDAARAEDQELLIRAANASTFAACPEILLAYRQGSYSASKTLKGRFGRARAFARHALAAGDLVGACRAWALALAKAGVDLAAALPGFDALYFRRMSGQPDAAQVREWELLWLRLRDL
jgi:glycosyltransferase involved in cell wall biosynthesis